MTKREQRVIQAFVNCVKSGEYSLDYAILLIEDNQRYGWISEEAKEVFYEEVEPTPVPDPEPVEELEEELEEEPETEPEPEVEEEVQEEEGESDS